MAEHKLKTQKKIKKTAKNLLMPTQKQPLSLDNDEGKQT